MANLPQELPEPPSSFKRHAITVLLIDDQVIISEAVRRMLADYPDIAFYYCQDPSKAVQMACDISPTVILLDLVMPEIDGLTLVKFFRANEKTRNIPLIVLSSKEEPDTKAEAFALGANDYLVKLPDKIELIARIRYHSNGYILRLQRNEAYEALWAWPSLYWSLAPRALAMVITVWMIFFFSKAFNSRNSSINCSNLISLASTLTIIIPTASAILWMVFEWPGFVNSIMSLEYLPSATSSMIEISFLTSSKEASYWLNLVVWLLSIFNSH